MNLDEYPDITDYKLKAIGKTYVGYTHCNGNATLIMELAIEAIEEFSQDVLAFIGRLLAKVMEDKRNE